MNHPAYYFDPYNNKSYSLSDKRWCSDDNRPLMISDLNGIGSRDIDTTCRSIWRYGKSIPVTINRPISLGEGCTPLIEKNIDQLNIHFKLEWTNPTGSFKDRGASVLISYLNQLNIKSVIEDSSGNGGAAIAAYAKAAGMTVKITAPASNSSTKLQQSTAYGAELEHVAGPRIASQDRAIELSDQYFYASHNWHPFFLQGTKTIGYEIWEDLNFNAPDNIIMPVGAGSNLLGLSIAFNELRTAGQIESLPRLFAVQPLHCSPLDAAFNNQKRSVKQTIAEGTAIEKPLRLNEMLSALKNSNGQTIAVSEADIIIGVKQLAKLGFFIEPTSASVYNALKQLQKQNVITAEQTTVIILTGSGLKCSKAMREIFS